VLEFIMAGLVPAISVCNTPGKDADRQT